MVLVLCAHVPWLTGDSVIKSDSKQYNISGSHSQSPSCSQWWPGKKGRSAPAKMQQKSSGVELSSTQVFISFRCFCRRWWHSCTSLSIWNDEWIEFTITRHQWLWASFKTLQCYFMSISECKKKTTFWLKFIFAPNHITWPSTHQMFFFSVCGFSCEKYSFAVCWGFKVREALTYTVKINCILKKGLQYVYTHSLNVLHWELDFGPNLIRVPFYM